ncbi:MAG: AAA family ATPase [Lachnospiraceae bacterium]|nr:AAA family ATPase [Lachnospiraceae bacterium]
METIKRDLLYYRYLLNSGVEASRIITISLDDDDYKELRESRQLSRYIKQRITDDGIWYVFLDEVQMCKGFESVLNGLNRRENLDIYVFGNRKKIISWRISFTTNC